MPGNSNSGRRPTKTAAQRKLDGSYRRDRHAQLAGVPELIPSRPPAPDWINADAKGVFDDLADLLDAAGVMAAPYAFMLGLTANTVGHLLRLERLAASSDDPKVLRMRNAMADRAQKLLREFGLSPAALTSVRALAEQREDASDKARFFTPRITD